MTDTKIITKTDDEGVSFNEKLPKLLHRKAKARAAEEGVTLKAFVFRCIFNAVSTEMETPNHVQHT